MCYRVYSLLGALLLVTIWPGTGNAQSAGARELTELKALQQNLQKGPGEPSAPIMGEYEEAIVRYKNLQEAISQSVGNYAVDLAQKLQELEEQLAAAAPAAPPETPEPERSVPPPDSAGVAPVEEHPPDAQPEQTTRPEPAAVDDYERLAQDLEHRAASLHALAQQLRAVPR